MIQGKRSETNLLKITNFQMRVSVISNFTHRIIVITKQQYESKAVSQYVEFCTYPDFRTGDHVYLCSTYVVLSTVNALGTTHLNVQACRNTEEDSSFSKKCCQPKLTH